MSTWWTAEELLEGLEDPDTSSTDNLTEEEQALIDRVNEIDNIIDTEITQPYPKAGVSGDV